MKRFAALFAALDGTTSTLAKVEALSDYFRTAPEPDRLWTIALLSGRRPKRAVNATELATWAAEAAGLPAWLFEESYAVAGDLAETIALVLPATFGRWPGVTRRRGGRRSLMLGTGSTPASGSCSTSSSPAASAWASARR
jgi:DNA ligase N terminus